MTVSRGVGLPRTSGARVELPPARYFATLGELAENYGGTSNVMFHRSNVIATHAGSPVEILVFGHVRDYAALDREMHADGRLVEGVSFRSMWTDLAQMDHGTDGRSRRGLRALLGARGRRGAVDDDFPGFVPLNDRTADKTIRGEGVAIRRLRKGSDGSNLQIDMLRADGSIIVSDRRDAPGSRQHSLVLCDGQGRPVREFPSLPALRRFWLDEVIGGDQAVLFSDTFGIAGFTHTYKRPNVVVVQTFHNQHLRHGQPGPLGYTEKRYLPFLSNIDDFDATVYLTERQRDDIDLLMGPAPNRHVVPNSRSAAVDNPEGDRQRTKGVLVGRLVAGKQVGHAVEAIVRANAGLDKVASLDIYGEGPERSAIERRVSELGARTVRLHGHVPGVAARFGEATFSVLTSRSESMPLVLVESMAHGCIPIAYDVRYGPRDIITDGVDGFLVAPGDVDGVARSIVRLQEMGNDELVAMRAAALHRAADFSDEAVLQRWAQVISAAVSTKVPPEALTITHHTTRLSEEAGGVSVEVDLTLDRLLRSPRAHLVLTGRADPALTRVECELTKIDRFCWKARGRIDAEALGWVTRGILDVGLDVHDDAGRASRRLTAPPGHHLFGPFDAYPTKYGNLSIKRG